MMFGDSRVNSILGRISISSKIIVSFAIVLLL
jgi:hypothetical protein